MGVHTFYSNNVDFLFILTFTLKTKLFASFAVRNYFQNMPRHGVDIDRNEYSERILYSSSWQDPSGSLERDTNRYANPRRYELENARYYHGEPLSVQGIDISDDQLWKVLVDLEFVNGKLVPGPHTRILDSFNGLYVQIGKAG